MCVCVCVCIFSLLSEWLVNTLLRKFIPLFFFFPIVLIYLFIYFFAALGLRCYVWTFPSCIEQGLLSGFGAWASYCNGLSCRGGWALGVQTLVAVA